MSTTKLDFEFDPGGSPEVTAAAEIMSAVEHTPGLIDYLRSLFGDERNDFDKLFGPPVCSFTTVADKVIVRLEPSVRLAELLSAVRAFEARRHTLVNVG